MAPEKAPKPPRVFKHPKRIRKKPLENRDRCIICQANRMTHPDRRYHRFPKDPVKCRKWVAACGIYEFANVPAEKMHSSYRVCSEHFVIWDYKTPRGIRLLPSAVPTCRKRVRMFPSNVMYEITIMDTESAQPESDQPVWRWRFGRVLPVYELGAEVVVRSE